ncbi:hypothetical protein [Bacillus subtilis]|uniref:hypothetical protein n=1 Tax=Bacillus subtilis TaxID=1423 RepID=UPI0012AD5081|nr:hypothetical protein [Bacillus subtilis]
MMNGLKKKSKFFKSSLGSRMRSMPKLLLFMLLKTGLDELNPALKHKIQRGKPQIVSVHQYKTYRECV